MSLFDIFVQVLGFVAWFIIVLSYYRKNTNKILLVQLLGNLLFCLHYLLLGAYSGLAICFLELLRDYSYYKTDWDNYIFAFSIPIYIIGGIFSYRTIIDLFPIIASLTDGWSLTKKKFIAVLGAIFSYGLWLVYDLTVKSYSGAITDTILILSNIYIIFTNKDKALKSISNLK